jgi:aconitate hydratase
MSQKIDRFGARGTFDTGSGQAVIYRLRHLAEQGVGPVDTLPFSIRVLLENALRNLDDFEVSEEDVRNLANWSATTPQQVEIPFKPARVVLQDFTGVPTVVDLAALRSAMAKLEKNPRAINPLVPVDLVIDHSVQVDRFGTSDAIVYNANLEFARNRERYEFLHWGQKSFDNFKVVPPATGIVHQVNLEYLAQGVMLIEEGGEQIALPDTLVGTDSHTTMINGLGVLGWGVGGIEAEAAMLGQPIYMLMPQVVGFRLTGTLSEGATATDLVLVITQMLRKKGVVDKFVEFYGAGISNLSLETRATIANMAPEYGATMGFFPVDDETLRYLRRTGRPEAVVERVERYCKEQGLFRTDETPDPVFTDVLELDLGTVQPSMAGPKRPQDRVLLREMKQSFEKALRAPVDQRGFALDEMQAAKTAVIENGSISKVGHGLVVIAAITSCTNTSNPFVMMAAGLVAKKAVERGLRTRPYVKTSLAPGSRVVSDYLEQAGLTPYLQALGFHTVGFGCTTCIGNSGPVPQYVADAVTQNELVAAAVLSGNRNFEGRINPVVKANYLASPPLVVAYALAGTVDIDLMNDPIGHDGDGNPVYLRDIWPSQAEVAEAVSSTITPEMFERNYGQVYTVNEDWNQIPSASLGDTFQFDRNSTYIQEPPYFENFSITPPPLKPIEGARVLALLGDSITTDHISPAGDIAVDSPAGRYLLDHDVDKVQFNSYGARRGNHEVMIRGTFANIRLRNQLVVGREGGYTVYHPTGTVMSIYEASQKYQADGTPLVILAGAEYGTGSSRDWAAKGTALLGVRAVIARSFERIHRSNLVMMGVLPLQFKEGESHATYGLTGTEHFDILGIDTLQPKQPVTIVATRADGTKTEFSVIARLDTPIDVEYYRNGGILPAVLRKFLN